MAQGAFEKVYGLSAVRAVMSRRPEDVSRIAHTEAVRLSIRDLLKEAAARKIAYEERSSEDLDRIADAVHHEGICASVRPRAVRSSAALIEGLSNGKLRSVLALDQVGNPHNVGAIVRSAAFFGVDAILIESPSERSLITPAAVRVAQGGAEAVAWVRCDSLSHTLREIARKANVAVIGMDVRGQRALTEFSFPARGVVVLGNEGVGLRDEVLSACTERLGIEGSGNVESLNVSVAAGVVLFAWARGGAQPTRR